MIQRFWGASHSLSIKHSVNHEGFKTNIMLKDQCYFIKAGVESAFWTQGQGSLPTPQPGNEPTHSFIHLYICLFGAGPGPVDLETKGRGD